MDKKILKIIWGSIYCIGTCITLILSIVFLSGSDIIINPNAMLPIKLNEQAFELLAFGAIPMVVACDMVHKIYEIKKSYYYKRNTLIIFMPGIICISCAIFIFAILFIGVINTFIIH